MHIFFVDGRRFVRCEVCVNFPEIVKQINKKKLPAITTKEGTRYRKNIYTEHISKEYHIECVKAHNLKNNRTAAMSGNDVKTPVLDMMISRANSELADYIGKLLINVNNDGKKLTLTVWSWPSRYVCAEAGNSFTFNETDQTKSIIPSKLNLQYVNLPTHADLLKTIVDTNRNELLKKIEDSVAISLRVDGSIARTHIDKIYVMCKLVNSDGSAELFFVGTGERTEEGAAGMTKAVKSAINANFCNNEMLFKKLSSICTDGANINTGQKNGLWALLQAECQKVGSNIDLIKIWCAAHRADLAWTDVSKDVTEIHNILSKLSAISSYFHTLEWRN